MSEKVDVVSDNPASILLLNAMVEHCGDKRELLKEFRISQGEPKVAVELRVNGVLVSFVEVVSEACNLVEASFETAVRKAAEDRLRTSRLANLDRLMSDFDWQIGQELDKLFPR